MSRGAHPRRLGPTARQHLRVVREAERPTYSPDPYAPQFGKTVVLAVEMACTSCPTLIAEGAEATYIDGELNCSECTWEARHP